MITLQAKHNGYNNYKTHVVESMSQMITEYKDSYNKDMAEQIAQSYWKDRFDEEIQQCEDFDIELSDYINWVDAILYTVYEEEEEEQEEEEVETRLIDFQRIDEDLYHDYPDFTDYPAAQVAMRYWNHENYGPFDEIDEQSELEPTTLEELIDYIVDAQEYHIWARAEKKRIEEEEDYGQY